MSDDDSDNDYDESSAYTTTFPDPSKYLIGFFVNKSNIDHNNNSDVVKGSF